MVLSLCKPVLIITIMIVGILGFSSANANTVSEPTVGSPAATSPSLDHVLLIMMENENINQTFNCGSSCSQFLTPFANNNGLAVNYKAAFNGSLPNYFALTMGQINTTPKLGGDCSPNPSGLPTEPPYCPQDFPNIVDRIEPAGLTWKAYVENYPGSGSGANHSPGGCSLIYSNYGSDRNYYSSDHNPFVYYPDIVNNTSRCSGIVKANSQPALTGQPVNDDLLLADLNNSTGLAPNFMWLSPDECDQMHHACWGSSSNAASIQQGSDYLSNLIPQVLNSYLFKTQRAAVFITFDEECVVATSNCGTTNRIYSAWASSNSTVAKAGYKSDTAYNHYSFLRTIESIWNLAPLTANDANAKSMTEFFNPPTTTQTLDSLHVNKTRIQDSSGHNVTLIGLNYGDYPNDALPNTFNTGSVSQDTLNMKSAGFNTVELVIEWGVLETSVDQFHFTYDSSYQNTLTSRVNALTSQGLYVVLKLHADCDITPTCNNLKNFLGPTQYCGATAPNGFLTPMGLDFYTTSANSNATSGMAHLTRLWQLLSSLTAANPLVVGYDTLNEPWYCQPGSSAIIRAAWHARTNEMVSALRSGGDNRMIFLEEAPSYEYYGDCSNPTSFCGVWFTASDITFTNWVSSVHYYQGEYVPSAGPPYAPCFGDHDTLFGFWNTTSTQGNGCTPSGGATALWVRQAELKNPTLAFWVGEYGDIYGNSPGDLGQSWNVNVTGIFMNDPHVVGWSYWAQGSTGTWTTDILPLSLVSVVRGGGNDLFWSKFGVSWSSWQFLGGSTASTPVLCQSTQGSLDLIVRGSDNSSIWHNHYNNGVWSGWDSPGGATNAQPACAFLNGLLYVVVKGTDNGIWWTSWNATSGKWTGWSSLGGLVMSSPVLVASHNRLDLMVEGGSNSIWHMALVNNQWSQVWDSPGGSTPNEPAAVSDGSVLHVVVRGMSDDLWYNSLSFGTAQWGGWLFLGGATPTTPNLAVDSSGTLHLVVMGMGGGVWYLTRMQGSPWSTSWYGLGGVVKGVPSLAVTPTGLAVLVLGQGQSIWYKTLVGSSWSVWIAVGGSTPSSPAISRV